MTTPTHSPFTSHLSAALTRWASWGGGLRLSGLLMAGLLTNGVLMNGCGGGSEPADESDPSTSSGSESTEDPTWAQMDHEQRETYMQETVTPQMRQLFQEFDAERYAEFNCATCHGENMQDVNFEMPNTLAPLVEAEIPAMFQSEEAMPIFMTQRVFPRMVQLLDAEPYDPQTHQGFGCLGCHATANAEGAAASADAPAK